MGSAPEDQRLGAGLLQVLRLLPAVSLAGTVGLVALMALAAVLPVGFVLASGHLVGLAPAVVDAGLGSPEGAALLRTLAVVSALYLGHQIVDQLSFVHGQNLGRARHRRRSKAAPGSTRRSRCFCSASHST